jgi:hypothetical protein
MRSKYTRTPPTHRHFLSLGPTTHLVLFVLVSFPFSLTFLFLTWRNPWNCQSTIINLTTSNNRLTLNKATSQLHHLQHLSHKDWTYQHCTTHPYSTFIISSMRWPNSIEGRLSFYNSWVRSNPWPTGPPHRCIARIWSSSIMASSRQHPSFDSFWAKPLLLPSFHSMLSPM